MGELYEMNTTGGGATAPVHLYWEPARSYPDPAVQTLDPRFDEVQTRQFLESLLPREVTEVEL